MRFMRFKSSTTEPGSRRAEPPYARFLPVETVHSGTCTCWRCARFAESVRRRRAPLRPMARVFRLMPERRIGVAIQSDVFVGGKDPLFTDHSFKLETGEGRSGN